MKKNKVIEKVTFTIIATIISVLLPHVFTHLSLLFLNWFGTIGATLVMVAFIAAFVAIAVSFVIMKKRYATSSTDTNKPAIKQISKDNIAVIIISVIGVAVIMIPAIINSVTSAALSSLWWKTLLFVIVPCSIASVLLYNVLRMKKERKMVIGT